MVVGPTFVYIAIPRTGTNTMSKDFLPRYGGRYVAPHHQNVVPRQYEKLFKFTIVRNPYDRMLSCWYHLRGSNDKWAVDKTPAEFVRACMEWKHGKSQSEFLGDQQFDAVLHYEDLPGVLLRLPFVQGGIEPLSRINKTPNRKPWQQDVTEEYIDAVNVHSCDDFARFGYQML